MLSSGSLRCWPQGQEWWEHSIFSSVFSSGSQCMWRLMGPVLGAQCPCYFLSSSRAKKSESQVLIFEKDGLFFFPNSLGFMLEIDSVTPLAFWSCCPTCPMLPYPCIMMGSFLWNHQPKDILSFLNCSWSWCFMATEKQLTYWVNSEEQKSVPPPNNTVGKVESHCTAVRNRLVSSGLPEIHCNMN